ncbi:MAG TPA: YceI family protein [Thermoanaerobaculia bacterium]|jgi:polyisoprenoid-binding protein YceI|nr:YceI family protein [Thermoanaerobaculia bacterium]
MIRIVKTLIAAVLMTAPGFAITFELDPQQTTLAMTFGATMHRVNGSLKVREGRIVISEGGSASGRIVIDLTTAQTGVVRRDRKMHEKILESARFPLAVFTIERMDGTVNRIGSSDIQLHGKLEMHGVTRQVALPARVTSDGHRVSASGVLLIPYLQWGMADPSFFILRVEKQVKVTVKTAGRISN